MSDDAVDNFDNMVSVPRWEHFEHQADIGVRGFGNTLEEAFEQSALGLCALITNLSLVNPEQSLELTCADNNNELLLVDWLNAIVYEIATRKMLFSRFHVAINQGTLTALAWGETINIQKHHPAVEIKGATYTSLAVGKTNGTWYAQCVVDV